MQLQGDGAGRRRPQREARRAVVPGHAQLLLRGGFRVERVEHTGDLQTCEHFQAIRAVLGDGELAAQSLLELRALELGQVEGEVAAQMRAACELVLGEASLPQCQLAEAPPAGGLVAVGGDPAARRGQQLPARRARVGHQVGRPGDRVRVDEVAEHLPVARGERIAGVDGELVGGRVIGEGHTSPFLCRERVVRPAGGAADAVVLVPGPSDSDLDLVGPAGQRVGGERVPAGRGVEHERGRLALRHPVLGTAQLVLERAGEHRLVGGERLR